MKSNDILNVKITTVTPLHISNRNTLLEDKDFYLEKNNLHRIDYQTLISMIKENNADYLFNQMSKTNLHKILASLLRKNKSKNKKSQEDWKEILRRKVGIVDTEEYEKKKEEEKENEYKKIKNILDKAEIYQIQPDFSSKNLNNKISELLIDNYYRSFIPGSTIKGAIRTAFYFNCILQNKDCLKRLRFTWTKNPLKSDYSISKDITGYDFGNFKKDIFNVLAVRDSQKLPFTDNVSIYQIKTMNIDTQKDEGNIVWKKGYPNNVASYKEAKDEYWEMFRPDTVFSTEIIIDHDLKKLIQSKGYSKVDDLDGANIIKSMNVFGRSIVEKELDYAKAYNADFLINFYDELFAKCKNSKETKEAYIPIGKGIPWHGKSVGSLLNAPSLDAIRAHFYKYMGEFIHIPCGEIIHGLKVKRRFCPKCEKQIYPNQLKCIKLFPKTRHIIFNKEKPAFPAGWLHIQVI